MEVKRVPEKVSGKPDGVEAMSECAVSRFQIDPTGTPVRMMELPKKYPCKIMASKSGGTVSISAHGVGVMLTVRLDEIMAVIAEAET